MAEPAWQNPESSLDDDPEIRQSIRVMQQQRTTKLVLVIAGMVLAIVVAFGAVYLAYNDEPDAAKTPPAAAPAR
jgi:hypothetical protein